MKRRGRTPRWVAIAFVSALLASACGNDSDADSSEAAIDDEAAGDDGAEADEGSQGIDSQPFGGHHSDQYADDANWLCRPGLADSVCDQDLDATVIHPDGTTDVQAHEPAADATVDCFYVYPTVSRDDSPNSDLEPGDSEERYVTLNQAARLTAACDVYAPVYRQLTLSMIGGHDPDEADIDDDADNPWEVAYGDVVDAFRHYMDNDNDGRGVVLVGHSQGASHLRQLLEEEVEGDPELLDRLVGAYLLGWGVSVPEGEAVGGDLQEVPACESADQVGCVVSYASYRSEPTPPERPGFGNPATATGADPAQGLLCVNPVDPALGGGDGSQGVFSQPYFQMQPPEGSLAGGQLEPFADPERSDEVTTPYVTMPDYIEVECRLVDGVSYLAVTVHGDDGERMEDIEGDLDLGDPEAGNWGLHLLDVSLAMGDLVDLVEAQAAAHDS